MFKIAPQIITVGEDTQETLKVRFKSTNIMKCAVTDETPSLTDWTKFNPATSHPADEPAPAMAQISSHNESLSMV